MGITARISEALLTSYNSDSEHQLEHQQYLKKFSILIKKRLLNGHRTICFYRTFRITALLGTTTKDLTKNLTSSVISRESP